MKESINKLKNFKWLPLCCFAAFVLVFSLVFTRLLFKMDDGNFLSIANEADFSYSTYLAGRYENWTGRTVGDFLVVFFLKNGVIWWKIINAFLIVYIAWFFTKISELFVGGISLKRRQIYSCLAMFTMMVSCLNPAVFWYTGSFFYLWPFAFMLMTLAPLIVCALGGKASVPMIILSVPSALIATAEEQSAACCTALYIILLIVIFVQKRKIKFSFLPALLPISVCDYFLFTADGTKARGMIEAANNFPRYLEMSLFDKLFCGLSAFFANSFYLSIVPLMLLVIMLCVAVIENKKLRAAVISSASVITLGVNAAVAISEKCLAHITVRKAFFSGEFNIGFYLLFACGCVLLFAVVALTVALIIKNKRLGLTVGLCLAAAFGSAMAMSFSASVFASGQRVYFYTEMFISAASLVLLSSTKEEKSVRMSYDLTVIYAALTVITDMFAFRFFELPLMG